MSIYVDSSALLKRYVLEPDSQRSIELLQSDPLLITARHTIVEVRRNLVRLLGERDLANGQARFAADIQSFALVEVDAELCESGAQIAEVTGVRTLDALHLAAIRRAGGGDVPLLTFDLRQAQVARSLGFTVIGA